MDIAMILTKRYEGSEWTLNGDNYSGLTWLGSGDAPTESELQKLWPEEQARVDAKASAIAKLGALGLTVDEVQVAFGLSA